MADDKTRYERLSSLVNEALLAASDEEIRDDVRAQGLDPGAEAARLRERLTATVRTHTKAKLDAAQAAVEARKAAPAPVVSLADAAAARRAKLERLLAKPGLPATLAARDGKGMSDRDVETMLEDLAELGVTDDEDPA